MSLKKNSVLLFVFLVLFSFFSSLAAAEIVITTPVREMYNLGDTLTFEGYILAKQDTTATVSVKLLCDSYSLENSAQLTLREGDKELLSQLGIHQFTLKNDGKTSCKITVTYGSEFTESKPFVVVDDLVGAFTLESKKSDYRLGDQFILRGTVFKKDGVDIQGTAKVYYAKDNGNAQPLGDVKITNGKMTFTYTFANLQFGLYTFDVEVIDTAGNKNYLKNVASFKLSNDLLLKAVVEKAALNPGDEVIVNGEILTNPIKPSDTTIKIKAADQTYSFVPQTTKFQYKFTLPNDISSGTYAVLVTISDKYGNSGYTNTPLTVRRVAKSLDIVVNKKTFDPGEVMELSVDVLDQTGKAMEEAIAFEIRDPNNGNLFKETIRSGQNIKVEFGQFSVPGVYTLTAAKSDVNLKLEESITVNSRKQLSVDYLDNTVYIKNQGNVEYKTPVDIVVVDKQAPQEKYYIVRKDVDLKPQDERSISLSQEVPPGTYDVYIDDKIKEQERQENEVTGNVIALSDLRKFPPSQIIERIKETQHVFSQVGVDKDNRGLGKRLSQGVSQLTGATTYSNENPVSGAFITALFIILVIGVLGVLAYKNREFYFQESSQQNRFKKDDHIFGGNVKHNDPFRVMGKTTPEERKAVAQAAAQKETKKSGWFSRKEEKKEFSPFATSKEGDIDPALVQDVLEKNALRKSSFAGQRTSTPSTMQQKVQQNTQQQQKQQQQQQPALQGFNKDFIAAVKQADAPQKREEEKKSDDAKSSEPMFKLDEDI